MGKGREDKTALEREREESGRGFKELERKIAEKREEEKRKGEEERRGERKRDKVGAKDLLFLEYWIFFLSLSRNFFT